MANTIFDSTRDKEQIAANTHFFCQGHLSAVLKERQSIEDKRFCKDCYTVIDSYLSFSSRNLPQAKPLQAQGIKKGVSKLPSGEILLPAKITRQKQGAEKHPGGRPKKQGEISRVTKWRRKREDRNGLSKTERQTGVKV